MLTWLRVTVLACAGALAASAACSAAPTFSPPPKEGCPPLYYKNEPVKRSPNGPPLCPTGPCNYQTQTGCGAGELCAPHVDQASSKIVPACRAAGTQKKGDSCNDTSPSATDWCGAGLACSESTCHTMCCGGDWTACDPGESCIWHTEMDVKGTLTLAGLDLCYAVGTCDPLHPSSCGRPDRTCRIADPTGKVACLEQKPLVEGDVCTGDNQCAGGLICAKSDDIASSSFTCRKLCPWGYCAAQTCTDAEGVCVHFNRDPPGVGECTPNFHGVPILVDGGFVGDAAALLPRPPPPSDGG